MSADKLTEVGPAVRRLTDLPQRLEALGRTSREAQHAVALGYGCAEEEGGGPPHLAHLVQLQLVCFSSGV